jgi:hypothetical protein
MHSRRCADLPVQHRAPVNGAAAFTTLSPLRSFIADYLGLLAIMAS